MRSKLSGVKDYLTFSKGERNGIIFLILLILGLMIAPLFYRAFVKTPPNDSSLFFTKVDSFFNSLEAKPDLSDKAIPNPLENEIPRQSKEIKYFYFDPNKANVDEMLQLGLSVKQALVVEKYRGKGGLFRSPQDFAKIYVIDSVTYHKLEPWIKIDPLALNSKPRTALDSIKPVDIRPTIVELNTTDTLELIKIKGIGRSYARRIIAYRNLLGGYSSIYQLSEVYGIKPELINSIAKLVTVDTAKIRTINVNLVSYEELKKHPYLSEFQAKAIIYYRSKVGTLKSVKELVDNKILPYDKFIRIKSYLVVH